MVIYELTADRIKDTAEKSGVEFEVLKDLYFDVHDSDSTVFVRTDRNWLQWVFVDLAVLQDPELVDAIKDDFLWEIGRIGGSNVA